MIEPQPGTDWMDLQCRVAVILQECGLVAEVAKSLVTARGTVEVDVYATDPQTTPPGIYLCECKRWRSRIPQGQVQTFRTVVADVGSHFGLFISAEGFQAGAYEVTRHTNVHLLDWVGFQKLFLERWCTNYWVPTLRSRGDFLAEYVDPVHSDAFIREAHGQPLEPAEAVGVLVHDMWGAPFNNTIATMLGEPSEPVAEAIWEHRNRYRRYLPTAVAEARCLRQLLDALLAFAERWVEETARCGRGTA